MNINDVQPLYANLWVKPLKEPEVTKGGIILTQETQERTYRAEVVAVGEGLLQDDNTFRPLSVKVGDEIIYAKYAGTAITFDGEEYMLINERDVHAVVRGGSGKD